MDLLKDLGAELPAVGLLALVHAGLGEFDEAFLHLGKGIEARDSSTLLVGTSVRGWGGLREDPRSQDLPRKIGPSV